MSKGIEETIVDMIATDEYFNVKLKHSIKDALECINMSELIKDQIVGSIEYQFEDGYFDDIINELVKQEIKKNLMIRFKGGE